MDAFVCGSASPRGHAPLAGKSNYLIGRSPADWLINIPQFAQVFYEEECIYE